MFSFYSSFVGLIFSKTLHSMVLVYKVYTDPCEIGLPVVQLMIFVMAGGEGGKSKQQKSKWRRNLSCIILINTTWTNLTKFWHKNEFKKHSMAKRACGKYLETVLRNNLGKMQQNVTM